MGLCSFCGMGSEHCDCDIRRPARRSEESTQREMRHLNHIKDLMVSENELRAKVAELHESLSTTSNGLHNASLFILSHDEELGDDYGTMACDAWGILRRTPAQSLAEVKAQALEEFADRFRKIDYYKTVGIGAIVDILKAKAKRLRGSDG